MDKKPNILFILSDQHNSQRLGCAGDTIIRTPSLDRLAQEGTMFDSAYCQNPLCVPSRSSLITGTYCRDLGIYTNTHMLEPNSCTIPRTFSENGYRTCLIGKAHFNGEQFHGYQQRPYGDLFGQAHQPDPRRTPENGEAGLGSLVGNAGPTRIPDPMTQTEICVSESSKWLQAHMSLYPEQPFFLSVHFDKPHFPVRCPATFFNHYKDRVKAPGTPEGYYENAVPFVQKAIDRFGYKDEDGNQYMASYYGCIEWMDNAIGRILQVLEYLGLAEHTIVIYSSDHGDLGGEKGAWNKTLFFDSSSRVPLIIRYPSVFQSHARNADPVGLIDLFPTLCEAADLEIPGSCSGESLLPILQGSGSLKRDHIFSESAFLGEPSHAGCMIRKGTWKYTYYCDGSEELYDLADDPGEWDNRAQDPDCKDTAQSLKKEVIDFWEPEKNAERIDSTPRAEREKHFYEFSNQFVLGGGTIADAQP